MAAANQEDNAHTDPAPAADPLPSWRDGHVEQAILDFVGRVTAGPDAVPAEDRVAVFDNDGTLWCEKPMPIQLDFILRRLVAMAEQDPELRGRQLLGFLAANGFANYIASGGGRDFMRPISREIYGIPRERVIGSSVSLAWEGGTIVRKPEADVLDDGPQKPVRIWSRIGRRPLLAAGNTNGDIPMLQFTEQQDRPSLRMLVRHDDRDREFDYVAGAERALELADESGWAVVGIRDDWATVF
ncbi:hypothetical protein ABZV58_32395 [Nocardia sp. NPDC004654]|uniref:hypothetical protein n=1 Tax=Nocardia sp. NPDC004654 TaxID=3154776 RepID=UPI0033B23C4C